MSAGMCPQTGDVCEFYREWCMNAAQGLVPFSLLDVMRMVHLQNARIPCNEIFIDADGPIDPVCAAFGAAVLIASSDEYF